MTFQIGMAGFRSIRSDNDNWVVEFPGRGLEATASPSADVLIRDGRTAAVLGGLDFQLEEGELHGRLHAAFSGTSGSIAVAGFHSVAIFDIASAHQLVEIPAASWRGPDAYEDVSPLPACSADGRRVAVASGSRLTLHDPR